MDSNNFTKAMSFSLKWEVGLDKKGNLKADGGLNYADGQLTKWGLYQKYNPEVNENTTLDEALVIYKNQYWDIYKSRGIDLNSLPVELATVICDSGINCGVGNAAKWYGTAKQTKDPIKTLLGLRDKYYFDVVTMHPDKKKNYDGWIARDVDLRKFVQIAQQDRQS